MKQKRILFLGFLILLLTSGLAYANILDRDSTFEQKLLWTRGEIVEAEGSAIVVKGEGAYPLVKVILNTKARTEMKPSVQMQGRYKNDMGVNLGLERTKNYAGTIIVDGKNAQPLTVQKLSIGKKVVAYYGTKATRSYPPQVQGEAVVLVSNEEKCGQYYVVDSVEVASDRKYVTVMNTNHDLQARIYGQACRYYRDIKKGTKLLLWSDIQTMSMPAQTNATHATILEL